MKSFEPTSNNYRLVLIFAIVMFCSFAQAGKQVSKTTAKSPPKIVAKAAADETSEIPSGVKKTVPEFVAKLKERINKLGYKWDLSVFVNDGWEVGGYSIDGYPLLYWKCGDPEKNPNSSLVLSAVHGDEVTPIFYGFRLVEWVKARPELCKDKSIVIAPIVNPDGFMRYSKGTRTNFNKVDINRNFDTPDWAVNAQKLWKERYQSLRRYYPGDKGGSEPETVFQQWLITTYKPVKIMSVHAPLNMLDYDGPADQRTISFVKTYIDSCETLKEAVKKATPELRFYAYGLFPGSLGNYAGRQRGIPVLTAELPSIDPALAAHYFSVLENGTRTFFEYKLKDSPIRSVTNQ